MQKPNLLCLHGALGCAAQMASALKPLENFYNLHFLDFPGHGERTNEALNMHNCAAATREFILKNNLAGSTILGYSMGGYVALLLAKSSPELVGQIITLGTKLAWNPHDAAKEIAKLNPEIIEQKVPQYAQALQKLHGDAWKGVLEKTAILMSDLGANPALTDGVFQSIQHPVLLCLASEDAMVTREETVQAARMLPNGEFAEIFNSKHPLEKLDVNTFQAIIKHYV
jgi:pimeloyl-ACP methyl ester carboxylesterase